VRDSLSSTNGFGGYSADGGSVRGSLSRSVTYGDGVTLAVVGGGSAKLSASTKAAMSPIREDAK
jgi:hypothetical protein